MHAQEKRFAVIIGNNSGLKNSVTLKYAKKDAKKMYHLLIEIGGFKPENTLLLLDKNVYEVLKSLKKIEKKALEYKTKTGQTSMLLIYYSGHAEKNALELSGTSLKFSTLHGFLKNSKIDVRLAFIDSCHSGDLIASKGMSRGKKYEINVDNAIKSKGYAIITSSSGNELSRESKELRGAFFTHYLVSALRGSGDISHDGTVTLQEAYKYVYARTLSDTVKNLGISQHPMYHFELKGQGDIVLTKPNIRDAKIEVSPVENGRLLLLDSMGETILAEADLKQNQPVWLTVVPGEYTIYIVKKNGIVRVAEFKAKQGVNNVTPDFFSTVKLQQSVARGGIFKKPEKKWIHKMGMGILIRSGHLMGMRASYGAAMYYRAEYINGFQPVLKSSFCFSSDTGVSTGYYDFGVYGGIGKVWHIYHMNTRVEVIAGYEHMFQSSVDDIKRYSGGFSYMVSAGTGIPVGAVFFALNAGVGMRIFKLANSGLVHRFNMESMFSVSWKLGKK